MVKIQLSGKFDLMYRTLAEDNSPLKEEVARRIKWFKANPSDTRLNNHALRKRMKGKYAFSITEDIRIVYEWLGKNRVRFLAIGGHLQVYKKHS